MSGTDDILKTKDKIKIGIASIFIVLFILILVMVLHSKSVEKEVLSKPVNQIDVSTETYSNDCYSCTLSNNTEKYNGVNKVKVVDCDLKLLESINTNTGKASKIREDGTEFKLYNIVQDKAEKYMEEGLKTDTYKLSAKLFLNYEDKKNYVGEIVLYRLKEISGTEFTKEELDNIKGYLLDKFSKINLKSYNLFGCFAKNGTDSFSIQGGSAPESGFFGSGYDDLVKECSNIWGSEEKFLSWCKNYNKVEFHQGEIFKYKKDYDKYAGALVIIGGLVIVIVKSIFKKKEENKE